MSETTLPVFRVDEVEWVGEGLTAPDDARRALTEATLALTWQDLAGGSIRLPFMQAEAIRSILKALDPELRTFIQALAWDGTVEWKGETCGLLGVWVRGSNGWIRSYWLDDGAGVALVLLQTQKEVKP